MIKLPQLERHCGTAEAGRLLGLEPPTIRKLVALKRIQGLRPAGCRAIVIPESEIRRVLREGLAAPGGTR